MESESRRPNEPTEFRTVVLRRYNDESVEVVAVSPRPAEPPLVAPRGCRVNSWSEGDAQVYEVELPNGYVIRPVDWRRFACDSPLVEKLLATCVRDNLADAVFSPWTESSREATVERLVLALQDLSSMLDVRLVTCEPGDALGEQLVRIEFSDVHHRIRQCTLVFGTHTQV